MPKPTSIRKLLANLPRPLIVIIAVSVALRVIVALLLGNEVEVLPGTFDQVSYHTLAGRVLDGHGFTFGQTWWPMTQAGEPTAHWSYLYTGYLIAVYSVIRMPLIARLIQAVLVGIAHPLLAWLLGRRVFNERAALMAAAVTTVYIYFVYYSGALMTESVYITFVMMSLYALIRWADATPEQGLRRALTLGLVFGSTILLRQLFLLLLPFFVFWVWWIRYRREGRIPFWNTVVVAGLVVLMITPAILYNYKRFDTFVMVNTNSGYAFYWGNHPFYGTKFIPILAQGEYRELVPAELRRQHLNEAALDRELLKRGIQFVVDDPGRYALLSLSRIPTYFMFWPSAESGVLSNISRVASFGLFFPFMIVGTFKALRQKVLRRDGLTSPAVPLMLFMLLYTAIHVLTWTLVRYRLPVDAVSIVFAAPVLVALLDWLNARKLLPARLAEAI